MAGHTPWQTLIDKMPSERRAESDARVAEMRRNASVTPAGVLTRSRAAELLGGAKPITDADSEAELSVGELSQWVHALGGQLEIVAHLPSGDLQLVPAANPDIVAPNRD